MELKEHPVLIRPDGRTFKCNISRHIADYRLYAVWQIMGAFAKGTNKDSRCSAASEILADAIGCSRGFIVWAQKEMAGRGLLIVVRASFRTEQGIWAPPIYAFAQHEDYAQYEPCPPYRFDASRKLTAPSKRRKRTETGQFK